jgi:ABC-type antimicrobial peptide transport system permease subunit
MAMGAKPGDIFRLVLKQGLRLAVVGLAVGLLLSAVLTRFIRGLLYGVSSMDIPTITVVLILLCAVTSVACFFPARRAARIDPNVALRYE